MPDSTHVVLPGSRRNPSSRARAVGQSNADEWVEITVKVRRKAPLPAVTDRPSVPLSRAELGAKYGASAEDMKKVQAAFEAYGLKMEAADPATRSIRFGGPVHAMEKAFQTKLMQYEHEQRTYRGRSGTLQIPAALKDMVVGVFGLDKRTMVKRRAPSAKGAASAAKPLVEAAAKTRQWFFPADLAAIYQFPQGDCSGETIGLIEFGGGYFPDDLAAFCEAAKVDVPTVVPISIDHQSTDAHDGAEGEVMLDVEVVAGVCPKATIPIYFSQFDEQGWVNVLDAAVHDQKNAPTILSISWGLAEDDANWSQGAIEAIDESLREAALVGVTVCVASGDDGSGDMEEDDHAHVDFPASSPHVLAVGGTTLHVHNGKPVEVAWKDGDGKRADGGGSTGGGVSMHFKRPQWQTVSIPSVNPGAIDGRVVPDVAAEAETNLRTTGYFYVVDGKSGLNGGTSAATPLWAALLARINASLAGSGKPRLGFLTPLLYKSVPGDRATIGSLGCTDITSGENNTAKVGGYSAMAGYDAVSGWGSPLGEKLMAALHNVL